MSQWKEYKLGEIADKITKGTTPSTMGGSFLDKGINFIKAEAVTKEGTIDESTFAYIDSTTYDKLKRSQLQEGDILFSMAGVVLGKTAIVEKRHLPANTNQALALIRINPEIALPKFVKYFLGQKKVFDFVNSSTAQSAQPNINLAEIGDLKIILPPLPTQTAIASILSSLDQKIELNNAINRNLEALAQALFKQWFVEFEFPNENGEPYKSSGGEMVESELGMIPKGWRVYSIGEILETISKTYPLKKVNEVIFLNTGDISEGNFLHSDKSDSSKLPGQAKKSIQKNDILYSEIRPANKRYAFVYFNTDEYVVSTKLMVLRPKVEINPLFPYFILTQQVTLDYLQQLAETRSGTFPQITFTELSTVKFAAKDLDFINEFTNRILVPRYELQFQTKSENSNLIKLRDTLLPKLISGELEVKDIDTVTV